MLKTFMPELDVPQRLQLLRDNCDKQEETTYYRSLSQEELDINRESLTENLIHISNEEDKLSEIKAEFKGRIDPKKAENKILLEQIKTRKMEVNGVLFHVADQDAGMMETYDEQGELVSSRRLRPDEKQMKAPFPLRTASNQ